MKEPTAYLVAYLDTTVMPPVVNHVGVYSESARGLTMTGRRECAVDVYQTTGDSYHFARINLLQICSKERLFQWCLPFLRKSERAFYQKV